MASETVVLAAGVLAQFSHSMEPQLRQLGLPTQLVKGQVSLLAEHTVCTAGEVLTSEQARCVVSPYTGHFIPSSYLLSGGVCTTELSESVV